MARRFGSAMISNTDSMLHIYATEHILVKVYLSPHATVSVAPMVFENLASQNKEEVKAVQQLLRHANSRITLDLYAQAEMPNKRLALSKTGSDAAEQGRSTDVTGPTWTMTWFAHSLQLLERIGGDHGTQTRGLCRDR
jgi:hypothetical protein